MESWRAERSGSPSVTSVKAKSCNSFKACDGRISTAMGATPDRFGAELFQMLARQSTAVAFLQQRIECAGDLALSALGAPGLCARRPRKDVEMRPGLRGSDEAIEEERRR